MTIREIVIHTGRLNREIENLKRLLKRIEDDRNKMVQEVQELNCMWQGPSNEAFNIQFRSDSEAFVHLCKTLREMIQAMEHAKQEYEVCDNRVNILVNALKI